MLSKDEAELMAHALGITQAKNMPDEFYRNRFCTSEGHADLPTIYGLVEKGYMYKATTINNGTSTIWAVTPAGIEALKSQ